MRPEPEIRAAIVAEAMTWLRTPWHHEARVKGAGVDCAQFLLAVYSSVGLIDAYATEHYPPDWHLHRSEPIFVEQLLRHCMPTPTPLPGDIAMFNFGRQLAHGGIVLGDNRIIHAFQRERVVAISEVVGSPLEERLGGYYRWREFSP